MTCAEDNCPKRSSPTSWLSKDLQSSDPPVELLNVVFEGNRDMVFVVTGDTMIAGANSCALTGFGYPREDMEGKSLEMLLSSAEREPISRYIAQAMAESSETSTCPCTPLNACDADGHEFPINLRVWPLTSGGKTYGICVCRRLDPCEVCAHGEFHNLVEETRDAAICLLDKEGHILSWNEGARRIYQRDSANAIGQHYSILFSAAEVAAEEPLRRMEACANSLEPLPLTQWQTFPGGRSVWLTGVLRANRNPSGTLKGFTLLLRDLTESKRIEERLRVGNRALIESEERFRVLVESVADYAIYMLDTSGRILTWNTGAERNKGYRAEEVLGQNYRMFFAPEAREARMPEQELAEATRLGSFEAEGWRVRKGGGKFWALVTLTAIRGVEGELRGFAKVTRDMTASKLLEEAKTHLASELENRVAERTLELAATVNELRVKNQEIEALADKVSSDLREKEVLLREVYHRVKNNLQVVQSLLKMGSRTLVSNDAKEAMETAVQRVHVMAMVHEHLYQMPNLAGLTLGAYLRDIVDGAIASNSERPDWIEQQFEIDEIPVPLDLAIPLGLLTNELVSNCLKHGIPHGQPGKVSITAQSIPGAMHFIVRDNGAGLPHGFDATKCKSMGLKLAASLAHQLGGWLKFTSDNGCCAQADLVRLSVSPGAPQPSAQSAGLARA